MAFFVFEKIFSTFFQNLYSNHVSLLSVGAERGRYRFSLYVERGEKELDRRSRREVLFCELPEIKRNVLLLSYFEELSDQAIAELMDATRNGIYKRRQSALQLMRELLQEEE